MVSTAASPHNRLNSVLTYTTQNKMNSTCVYKHPDTHVHLLSCTHTRMHTHACTHTTPHTLAQKSWIQAIVASGVVLELQPPTHIDGEGGRKGKRDTYPFFEAQERIFFF